MRQKEYIDSLKYQSLTQRIGRLKSERKSFVSPPVFESQCLSIRNMKKGKIVHTRMKTEVNCLYQKHHLIQDKIPSEKQIKFNSMRSPVDVNQKAKQKYRYERSNQITNKIPQVGSLARIKKVNRK